MYSDNTNIRTDFMKKANIFVSCILVAISLYFMFMTQTIKEAAGAKLGPRFFPYVVLLSIIGLSIAVIGQTLRSKEKEEAIQMNQSKLIKVIVTLVFFSIYIGVMDKIGFMISTIVFLFFLSSFYYGEINKGLIKIFIFSLVAPFCLYELFNNFFNVLLP